MSYAEKLKHPLWQKKRLEILQRDNFTCQICLDKEITLHVHHQSYENKPNPWEVSNESLVTLCEECHYMIEKISYDNIKVVMMYLLRLKKNRGCQNGGK